MYYFWGIYYVNSSIGEALVLLRNKETFGIHNFDGIKILLRMKKKRL